MCKIQRTNSSRLYVLQMGREVWRANVNLLWELLATGCADLLKPASA